MQEAWQKELLAKPGNFQSSRLSRWSVSSDVCRRLKGGLLCFAMEAWKENVQYRRRLKRTAAQVMVKSSKRTLGGVFLAWHAAVQHTKQCKLAVVRSMQKVNQSRCGTRIVHP